jgi:alpha-1,3-fucosyltransferase
LVRQLQANGIDVDIYGRCSNQTCSDCNGELRKAKFYLAFENSLCTDYVTEKLYKMTYDNVVPVVYSGADLNRFMPPRSYIDANAFATVEKLAEHLKYLSENPQELVKYFWWKKYYKIREQWIVRGEQLCKICQKLNEPNLWERQQFYPSIKAWNGKNMCKDPSIKF